MPIIKRGDQAREILNDIIAGGKSLPCFCTESVYTTEAIFKGVQNFRNENKEYDQLPVMIAFTASYEGRQQLKNYTGLSSSREGILAMKSDIERLARPDGPYPDIKVIVHLDHAQPGKDNWIIEEYSSFISSVMWDCSQFDLKENKEMTKNFVTTYKAQFIIEGAVDEIYNYNPENHKSLTKDEITDPAVAEQYFIETGCDLIVVDLGTEHRRTEGTIKYRGDVARELSNKIGRRLVLHGTSSLSEKEISGLPGDGIVKVNVWSKLESDPGKKLAHTMIQRLEHLLPSEMIQKLIEEGFLNERMKLKENKPSIHYLTEKFRRDEVYLPTVAGIVRDIYSLLF